MGRIVPNGKSILVEFRTTEMIEHPAYIIVPGHEKAFRDYIGNIMSRAAWMKVKQRAPAMFDRFKENLDIVTTKIDGTGLVRVTFTMNGDTK